MTGLIMQMRFKGCCCPLKRCRLIGKRALEHGSFLVLSFVFLICRDFIAVPIASRLGLGSVSGLSHRRHLSLRHCWQNLGVDVISLSAFSPSSVGDDALSGGELELEPRLLWADEIQTARSWRSSSGLTTL